MGQAGEVPRKMTLEVKVRGKQKPEDGEPEVGVILGSVSPRVGSL